MVQVLRSGLGSRMVTPVDHVNFHTEVSCNRRVVLENHVDAYELVSCVDAGRSG